MVQFENYYHKEEIDHKIRFWKKQKNIYHKEYKPEKNLKYQEGSLWYSHIVDEPKYLLKQLVHVIKASYIFFYTVHHKEK